MEEGEIMPRGDGSGPMGMGPMTGRAAGYCAGNAAPGYANPVGWRGAGRGMGWGRGLGRGWGRGWMGYAYSQPAYPPPLYDGPYAPPAGDVNAQLATLQNQAKWMRDSLSQIEEQIRALEVQSEE